mmetsp:Transcript_8214/g.24610  ORF Transcript_8214/g.24610 Transcript_8214/m.24610 type:complete len:296 (+) Transcript_8214:140-1027(+)
MSQASRRKVPPHIHSAAGVIAGACSTTLLYPLDLVKVRFQADTSAKLPSVVGMVSRVARAEGARALFAGLTPALLGSALSWGGFFFFYEKFKPQNDGTAVQTAGSNALASVKAGAAMVLLTNPVWLVKTRLQLQGADATGRRYAGVADAFRSIVRDEGWRALYRGVLPALLLTSHGAVQLVVYEQLKRLRPPSGSAQGEALAYGAVAKLAAATATYPYQVVKTRVQRRYPETAKYSADLAGGELARTWRCVADTARAEGARGFFKGVWPNALRVAPSAALTFWCYEVCVNAHSVL